MNSTINVLQLFYILIFLSNSQFSVNCCNIPTYQPLYMDLYPLFLFVAITDSEAPFNVINILKPTASQMLSVIEHKPPAEEENTNLTTSKGISMDMVEDVVLLPPFKSSVSLGYRYLFFSAIRGISNFKDM